MPNYNFNFNGKKKGIEWSIMAGVTGGVRVDEIDKEMTIDEYMAQYFDGTIRVINDERHKSFFKAYHEYGERINANKILSKTDIKEPKMPDEVQKSKNMPNYSRDFNGKKKGAEWSTMAGVTGGVLVGKRDQEMLIDEFMKDFLDNTISVIDKERQDAFLKGYTEYRKIINNKIVKETDTKEPKLPNEAQQFQNMGSQLHETKKKNELIKRSEYDGVKLGVIDRIKVIYKRWLAEKDVEEYKKIEGDDGIGVDYADADKLKEELLLNRKIKKATKDAHRLYKIGVSNNLDEETFIDQYLSENGLKLNGVPKGNNNIETNILSQMDNVQNYSENINKCKSVIISGVIFEHCDKSDALDGQLYASSRVGNFRENQEDAVLLAKHPLNEQFKMLVVADGMGGYEKGEYASDLVVNKIEEWFKSLDSKYYSNEKGLRYEFRKALNKISKEVGQEYRGAGSTFVGAIVGKHNTIIANVGDSRAYISKKGSLEQVTKDQSTSYSLWERGGIEQKDDIRFHKDSNMIECFMGMPGEIDIDFYNLENKSYDTLLLFSDGVTDCLSDEKIKAFTRDTSRKELAKTIADMATKTQSEIRPELAENYQYHKEIPAGKDNATAAVYSKKDRGGEER